MDQTVLKCAATTVEIQTNATAKQESVQMDVRQDGRNLDVKNVGISSIFVASLPKLMLYQGKEFYSRYM